MRRYADADEEAIRTAGHVRDWKQSGLLDPARAAAIESQLATGLKRTHWALRGVLFFFSASVIQSAVGFVYIVLTPDEPAVAGLLALIAGVGAVVVADLLIARFGFYRFGIEEACVVCAIVLIVGGVALFASAAHVRGDYLALVAFATAAFAGAAAYWRFGLLYCAAGATVCAAITPFFLDLPEAGARVAAAVLLLGIHAVAGLLRRPFEEDFPGDDYGIIESTAWLGIYAALNLELKPDFLGVYSSVAPAFYWATYAAIWLMPIVGLYRGIRQKHHWMIRASLLTALATLVTNKLYLGWPHHTWDPILLGVLLVATALGVRRWLTQGAEGQRNGFTPLRLLGSDEQRMGQVAMVTGAFKPEQTVRGAAPTEPDQFGGGRSGGAGAGGAF
jgi:hypothetical protein